MENLKNEHMSSAELASDHFNENEQKKQGIFTEPPQQQGKQRATVPDNHKKEFLCDCGKSYLSTAALFTHIKQKHPDNPQINAFSAKKNKPKKIENTPEQYDWILDVFPKHFFKNSADYFGVLQQLERLINHLKVGDQSSSSSTENCPRSDQQQTQFSGKQLTNDVSIPKDQSQNAAQCQDQMRNEMNVVDVYDFIRDLRITSINRIISIFILNVSKIITPTGFTEILVFLTLFRKGLNEKSNSTCASPLDQVKKNKISKQEAKLTTDCGQKDQQELKSARELKTKVKIEERQQNQQEEDDVGNDQQIVEESKEFCSQNSGEFIGEFANQFITELLPAYFENTVANVNELLLLGPHEEGMKNSCYLLQLFINWMYVFKFSSSKVSLFSEQEEQQQTIPFVGEIQNKKQRKYDTTQSQQNESKVNQKYNSIPRHLQNSLQNIQNSSLNVLDRIQSAGNLDGQRDPNALHSNVIKSFDDGTLLEKNHIKNGIPAYFVGPQSAATSTTFAGFHGSACNSTSYAYRGNSTSYAQGGNSTSYAQGGNSTSYAQGGNSTSYAQRGNSTTFFSQPSSVSGIGSTCFNFGSQKLIADSSTPHSSSVSYPPNSFYNEGCRGQTVFAAQQIQPCFSFINQPQFIAPVQFYGIAYGQNLEYQMQRIPLQYYYPQNRQNYNFSYYGGAQQFQDLH